MHDHERHQRGLLEDDLAVNVVAGLRRRPRCKPNVSSNRATPRQPFDAHRGFTRR
jgi:hypothetical protein